MIQITEMKTYNKPFHKATVSIKIEKWGGFRIKRIKVFEKDGNRWISLPSEEYEKEGKKKYYALNDFEDPEMNEAFRKAFFKSYDEHILQKMPSLTGEDINNKIIPF